MSIEVCGGNGRYFILVGQVCDYWMYTKNSLSPQSGYYWNQVTYSKKKWDGLKYKCGSRRGGY